MAQSGFTGISYPFRVTNRGGCAMSTTSKTDPTHIAESIQQIFGTSYLERPMYTPLCQCFCLSLMMKVCNRC